MSQLINKTDISQYRDISNSVKDTKINPIIEDAQLLDLLPLLGEKFYFDLVAKVADYGDLMNPKSYVYDGKTVQSPGIKRVLVDFAYARYMMHGSQTDTPFGFVNKTSEDSTPVVRGEKKEGYKYHQQIAMQYWGQVELYLSRNYKSYPLWRSECLTERKKGFRLNFITK